MPTVTLETGATVTLEQPYGHEHSLSEGDRFRADVLLSPINSRVQVLRYEAADFGAMTEALTRLADLNDYGKVWVKAPAPVSKAPFFTPAT